MKPTIPSLAWQDLLVKTVLGQAWILNTPKNKVYLNGMTYNNKNKSQNINLNSNSKILLKKTRAPARENK